MDAVYLPKLAQMGDRTQVVIVHEDFPDLHTLTPARGEVKVTHQGNYLEVTGVAEAIVTLTCDRCLQQYNHRLQVDLTELIWLEASVNMAQGQDLEREVPLEDLVEMMPSDGEFYPVEWLYQQLCLALPLRQLCHGDCEGIVLTDQEEAETVVQDRRWASLMALKEQLSSSGF